MTATERVSLDQARVTVVVPTYNERENLAELVDRVFAACPGCTLLIVDDASPDGTGAEAESLKARFPRLDVLHRDRKTGLGDAYRMGFRRALDGGASVLVSMDADLSHDPAYLPGMLRMLEEHDVVVGSRYLRGISIVNWPLSRLVLSAAANRFARAVTRLPVRDCTSGFVAYRRRFLETVPLERLSSQGYEFMVEMKYRAFKGGFSLAEFPIVFRERDRGRSKMSAAVALRAFPRVLLLPVTARGAGRGVDRPSPPRL